MLLKTFNCLVKMHTLPTSETVTILFTAATFVPLTLSQDWTYRRWSTCDWKTHCFTWLFRPLELAPYKCSNLLTYLVTERLWTSSWSETLIWARWTRVISDSCHGPCGVPGRQLWSTKSAVFWAGNRLTPLSAQIDSSRWLEVLVYYGDVWSSHIVSSDRKEVLYGASPNTPSTPLTSLHKPAPPPQHTYTSCTSSSCMHVMNHNWSATKQRLRQQSVAEISHHSVLSGDRIWQCVTSSGSRCKDTDQCL